jgi:hypothetical protein
MRQLLQPLAGKRRKGEASAPNATRPCLEGLNRQPFTGHRPAQPPVELAVREANRLSLEYSAHCKFAAKSRRSPLYGRGTNFEQRVAPEIPPFLCGAPFLFAHGQLIRPHVRYVHIPTVNADRTHTREFLDTWQRSYLRSAGLQHEACSGRVSRNQHVEHRRPPTPAPTIPSRAAIRRSKIEINVRTIEGRHQQDRRHEDGRRRPCRRTAMPRVTQRGSSTRPRQPQPLPRER